MQTTLNSLFDIHPDSIADGGVVIGFRQKDSKKALSFPCVLETADAMRDERGRFHSSDLGLEPVVVTRDTFDKSGLTKAWFGNNVPERESETTGLSEVYFTDGVTKIDKDVFANIPTLRHVDIPDGVKSIGKYAFSFCTGLRSVRLPESLGKIDNMAFICCENLTDISIPRKVRTIADSTFAGCENLVDITLPATVKKIGDWAFRDCTGLTSITIPSGVTEIASNAFDGCTAIESFNVDENNRIYTSVDGVLMNKEKTAIIRYPIGKSGSGYVIPDGVTHIADHAFSGCDSLSSVTIPEGVTSIGGCAFSGCSGLTNITIPKTIEKIGDMAFYRCTELTSITIPKGVTVIGDWALKVVLALPASRVRIVSRKSVPGHSLVASL